MSNITRTIQSKIEQNFWKGKVIIIYGPRQVGKTTLAKQIQSQYLDSIYFNCDEPDTALSFQNKTSTQLKALIGNVKLVIIDEAQRVKNIGITLKLLVDNYPEIQVIATGSSSFDISNTINEPLTGRVIDYVLYPFSWLELSQIFSNIELQRLKDWFLVYGTYPEVVFNMGQARDKITRIARNYLYKDVLIFQDLRSDEKIHRLLQALALQVGQEVSYTELATLVELDQKTVSKYIQILEKSFVIFRLPPLSRNPRKEISKSRKVYFFDNGVRNALINNFNDVEFRNDKGNLFEQFIISQRIAANGNNDRFINNFFWRTKNQSEIDYIEEIDGALNGFEIKYGDKVSKEPKPWKELYTNSTFQVVNKDSWEEFLKV